MMNKFEQSELPLDDLRILNLIEQDTVLLDQKELKALLEGRITDLLTLKNVTDGGFQINLKARISLARNEGNTISLLVHPVYNQPKMHEQLSENEKLEFLEGRLNNTLKKYAAADGSMTAIIIEYDAQCRQFVEINPDNVLVPLSINGYPLSVEDGIKFKYGQQIEFLDGSVVQRRESVPDGITSNRDKLILRYDIDNRLYFDLREDLENLCNSHDQQKDGYTKSFSEELAKMQIWSQQQHKNPDGLSVQKKYQ